MDNLDLSQTAALLCSNLALVLAHDGHFTGEAVLVAIHHTRVLCRGGREGDREGDSEILLRTRQFLFVALVCAVVHAVFVFGGVGFDRGILTPFLFQTQLLAL